MSAIVHELRLIREEARQMRDEQRQTNARLVTLEEVTVNGFRAVGERLGSVEGRIESVEAATLAGFRSVHEDLEAMRTVAIERQLDLDQRVRRLEGRMDSVESDRPPRRRR